MKESRWRSGCRGWPGRPLAFVCFLDKFLDKLANKRRSKFESSNQRSRPWRKQEQTDKRAARDDEGTGKRKEMNGLALGSFVLLSVLGKVSPIISDLTFPPFRVVGEMKV